MHGDTSTSEFRPPARDLSTRLSVQAPLARSARQTLGPAFDSGGASGSSAYRLRGADTLTWGPATAWIKSKVFLADALQLLNPDILADMSTPDQAALMTAMQALAQHQATLRALPPSDSSAFAAAVRSALAGDQPQLARTLAEHGHRLYPEHAELARLAQVLAPPKVSALDLPPDPDVALNWAWLDAHGAEYVGQWVAVRRGELQGAAATVPDLKAAVGDFRGMLITRVL